jgi:Fur family ferric uptake transcriptional regulator
MNSRIETLCQEQGLKMTGPRRVIARVLSESDDHPDVEELHRRASTHDPSIAIATVYRTVRLFEQAGILDRHDFGDGRARYEETPEEHHDHLIDIHSGDIVEFRNDEIERLQQAVARRLGYRLVDHRLELYGVRLDRTRGPASGPGGAATSNGKAQSDRSPVGSRPDGEASGDGSGGKGNGKAAA